MTAAAADRNTPIADGPNAPVGVAGSTEIFGGTLVNANASGYAKPGSDTSGEKFLGLAPEGVNNTGANGAKSIAPQRGIIAKKLASTGLTFGQIGEVVYVYDDQTVTDYAGSTNKIACGILRNYVDGLVDVEIQQIVDAVPSTPLFLALDDRAALSALVITTDGLQNGMVAVVESDNSMWVFDADGVLTEDESQALVIEPDSGAGQWLRMPGAAVLRLPVTFANTDGEAILTVPTGFVLRLLGAPYFHSTAAWTGGTSSAIGFSTNLAGYTTKGDLWGTASGQVEAALGAGAVVAALGGELDDDAGFNAMLMPAATEIQFDRVVDAFTAGAGQLHVPVSIERIGAFS